MIYKYPLPESTLFFVGDIERVIDEKYWNSILEQTDHFEKGLTFSNPHGIGIFAPVIKFDDPYLGLEKYFYSDAGIFGVISFDSSMYPYIKKQYQKYVSVSYPPFMEFWKKHRCFGMLIPGNQFGMVQIQDNEKLIIDDTLIFTTDTLLLPEQ